MEKNLYKGNIFYGWFIVAACFIIITTSWGIVYNCAGIFIKPISAELGFTRSQISATMTIRAASHMILALFSGKIFSKYNMIKLMKIATITLFASFFIYSYSISLATFYFFTIITSISVSLISFLPISIILSNWFYERRGFVLGLAFMGSGIGGMIFNSLAGQWIISYGWRSTYQILAIIMLITITPCTFFIIRLRPKDIGLAPLGKSTNTIPNNDNLDEEGIMLSEAIKTIRFWAIFICTVIIAMGNNTLIQSLSPHLSDIGYSVIFSANITALSMGSLAIGKLVLGKLFDSVGIRKATTISIVSTFLAIIGMIYAKYNISIGVIIISSGIGCAFTTISNPIIAQGIFGRRDYSSIYGVLTAASGLGGVFAPIFSAYYFDKTGSYNFSYNILAILCFGVIITFQLIFPKQIE